MRAKALELAKAQKPTPTNLTRVTKATTEEAARWAFTQWDLRNRAKAKFAKADEMLFDLDGLQMATHERIADYHASRFPQGALVADFTVGIGADLIALARRGPTVGYDLDPARVELARHNLLVHRLEAPIKLEDALQTQDSYDYAFADPARRTESKRTLNPAEFSPNPVDLTAKMAEMKLAAIKLSPLLQDVFLESLGPQLEFVSFGGECREALIWTGKAAQPGRFAVHVESGQTLEAKDLVRHQNEAAEYILEADPAAIRAHALGNLAEQHNLTALADSNGYLTGPAPVDSPWLTPYKVLADHPADVKRTKEVLRTHNSGTPVVKSRAKDVDVQSLRKQWRGEGVELVVVVYSVGKKLRHAVCQLAR